MQPPAPEPTVIIRELSPLGGPIMKGQLMKAGCLLICGTDSPVARPVISRSGTAPAWRPVPRLHILHDHGEWVHDPPGRRRPLGGWLVEPGRGGAGPIAGRAGNRWSRR